MKKFTLIGFTGGLVIIAALLFWHYKRHSNITETHVYMIAPDVFFAGLEHLITPKNGESHQQLLTRYFKQQNIYLEDKNAVGVYLNETTGIGHLQVHILASDQEKVEQLITDISKAR
jgi:hypothetical protein